MWDVVWDPTTQTGSWGIDPETEDLTAKDPVSSAVILALFTDKPLPVETSLASQKATWHGNAFDADEEAELGSFLWTLDRSFADDQVILRAKSYISEALQPLIDQKLIRGYIINEIELQKHVNDVWLAFSLTTLGSTDLSFFFKYPVA